MSEMEQITSLLHELRDVQQIEQLKSRYCHLVDARDWDALAALWTEDATCDYGFFGSYRGRDEIMDRFFRERVDSVSSFMVHMVHNPLIEVRGDRATGSWYLTAQTTIQPADRAVWAMGIYRDEFERVGGEWKIRSLAFEFKYYTPFEDGWARTRIWEIPD